MKFSIALATVATILSVTSAVPVALERRGAAALNKRALLTRDDHDHHDDHIDFHHLSHDEEKALYQTGDYYPELFSEQAYDHKGEEKHDEHDDEHDDHGEHDDHEDEGH